jgi:hypothetical protein
MTSTRQHQAIDLALTAKDWPTVTDLANQTGITGRILRRAIADGHLPALRLNVLRVNPDDFASWFAARQK